MADQILTLSTVDFDRPTVIIDEVAYEMRSPDEMSIEMIKRMEALGVRMTSFQDSERGERDYDDLAAAAAESVQIVMVDIPPEVVDSLPLGMQGKISKAFMQLVADDKAASPTN